MKKIKLKENEVLVLRSVDKDLKSRNSFQYPKKGLVVCPDYQDNCECGNGLHGLEFGNTIDYDIVSDYSDLFLIIRVNKTAGYNVIDENKVKFKEGYVELVFDNYNKALDYLRDNYKEHYKSFVRDNQIGKNNETQKAGGKSTQTALNESTQTVGDWSTQTAGSESTQTAGYCSTQTAGSGSTQTAGSESTQTAGYSSTQTAGNWSTQTAGNWSVSILYKNGVQRLDKNSVGIINNYNDKNPKQLILNKPGTYYIKDCEVMKEYSYTPENIETLEEYEVFVFGSNGEGAHTGGAAKIAKEKFGAIEGQAEGIQGSSFAINTMDGIEKIKEGIEELRKYACKNTMTIFYLTKIGCGIAGYKIEDIKPLAQNLPANIILPKEFN